MDLDELRAGAQDDKCINSTTTTSKGMGQASQPASTYVQVPSTPDDQMEDPSGSENAITEMSENGPEKATTRRVMNFLSSYSTKSTASKSDGTSHQSDNQSNSS